MYINLEVVEKLKFTISLRNIVHNLILSISMCLKISIHIMQHLNYLYYLGSNMIHFTKYKVEHHLSTNLTLYIYMYFLLRSYYRLIANTDSVTRCKRIQICNIDVIELFVHITKPNYIYFHSNNNILIKISK